MPIDVFAEYGTIGVVVLLFSYMIMSIIKSLKVQNEDIDELRQAIHKMESVQDNTQSIVLKLVDRINVADANAAVRNEKTTDARSKTMERFGSRIERLERTTIRLEGRVLNGYKGD